MPLLAIAVGASLTWAYWPTLVAMARKWADDPQYSHGYLVAPFALFLLWTRRHEFPARWEPSAWGLALLGLGAVLRLAGGRFYHEWVEGISLLPSVAGLVVLAGGWPALRVAWPAVAFFFFMLPLPHRVETALAGSLQRITTVSCAAVLHTFDQPVIAEGNVLVLDGSRVEVAVACSGLGSLLVFFAMAQGVALLSRRPLLDQTLLVLSAVPVALAANVMRVTATVLLHERWGSVASHETWHELAGWLMMALALAILWVELRLLRLVFLPPSSENSERGMPTPEARNPKRIRLPWSRIVGTASLAVALSVLHGLLHGWWTDRWGESADPGAFADRLAGVPLTLGEWVGEPLTLDPRRQKMGEIRGYVLRRYVHRRRGTVLSLLLVCGRPGPISVHTPDVCYRGAGYEPAGPEERQSLVHAPGAPAEFWVGSFRRRDETSAPLRIHWAWNDQRGWRAPDFPRLAFGGAPALYKLYVVRETFADDRPGEVDPGTEFLRLLLPALDRALFSEVLVSP